MHFKTSAFPQSATKSSGEHGLPSAGTSAPCASNIFTIPRFINEFTPPKKTDFQELFLSFFILTKSSLAIVYNFTFFHTPPTFRVYRLLPHFEYMGSLDSRNNFLHSIQFFINAFKNQFFRVPLEPFSLPKRSTKRNFAKTPKNVVMSQKESLFFQLFYFSSITKISHSPRF